MTREIDWDTVLAAEAAVRRQHVPPQGGSARLPGRPPARHPPRPLAAPQPQRGPAGGAAARSADRALLGAPELRRPADAVPLRRLRRRPGRARRPRRRASCPRRCARRWRCRASSRRSRSTGACSSTAAWPTTSRPTSCAAMSVDVVIAVDVGVKPAADARRHRVLDGEPHDRRRDGWPAPARSLASADVVITPDVSHLTGLDWNSADEWRVRGYRAAEAQAAALLKYSVSQAEYDAHEAARLARRRTTPIVPTAVVVDGRRPARAGRHPPAAGRGPEPAAGSRSARAATSSC